ncbi:transposase [Candidatus Protochlamydia amoebophila]|uniref:transposase n=1 Tax=Candidatus Protochlamydia amoebophila TaxID=362787 RepID=UPI0009B5B593
MPFLPLYSPELNPIKLFWDNLKRILRENLKNLLRYLKQSIDYSFLACAQQSL